jgi:hypothetical protein
MGKAPEVDIARAQLKLLVVHGSMERMEAYPVAYYDIVKTKDGIACRPVAQEVIGRAAFLLVYAAIVYAYVVHFWLPFITWVYGDSKGFHTTDYFFLLFFSSLALLTLFYDYVTRLGVWCWPVALGWIDNTQLNASSVYRNAQNKICIVLPSTNGRDGIHSLNDPIYKLTAYLSGPVVWFFLIGTLEGLSLVLAAVFTGVVLVNVFDFSQQTQALWLAKLIWWVAAILFAGMCITRIRVWKLVTYILENEPLACSVQQRKRAKQPATSTPGVHVVGRPRGLGQSAGIQPPVSERPVRTFFPNYSIAGMILWGLFLLAKYLYNLGKDKRPEK